MRHRLRPALAHSMRQARPVASQEIILEETGFLLDSLGSHDLSVIFNTVDGGYAVIGGEPRPIAVYSGVGDLLSVAASDLGPTGITLYSAWINLPLDADAEIMSFWESPFSFIFRRNSNDSLGIIASNTGTATSTAASAGTIPLNTWTHVAGLIDLTNDQLIAYVNGVAGTPVAFTPAGAVATRINLGGRTSQSIVTTGAWTGNLAYPLIALGSGLNPTTMVAALYNGGIPPKLADIDVSLRSYIKAVWAFKRGSFTKSLVSSTQIIADGAWTWFGSPEAVHYNNKTYVGAIGTAGDIRIACIDHGNGDAITSFVLETGFYIDDHNNPAIHIRQDGRILAVWADHGAREQNGKISTNPEDISAWGSEINVGVGQYSVLERLTAESNRIYLFSRRSTNGPWDRQWSDDGGATWNTVSAIIQNGTERPYPRIIGDGVSKIHFMFTDGHANGATNSIYHCYYEAANWYKSDGTLICADAGLPVTPLTATKVYDDTTNGKAWSWDIILDGSGYPVIIYAVFAGGTYNHLLYYSRWDGSAWHTYQVDTMGANIYADELYYSPGATLYDANTIYMAKNIAGKYSLWKLVSPDLGATWNITMIRDETTDKQMRPVSPRNPNNAAKVLWMEGVYSSWQDYHTSIYASQG